MDLAQAVTVFFLSTVKFMFAPGVAAAAGFNIFQTILLTASGGMTGITVFYYFGRWIITKIDLWRYSHRKVPKKVFTKRNKIIVKLKGKYGLIGLLILTPSFLSIPIGSVVAAKFFHHNKLTYPLLLVATVVWSIVLSILSHSVKSAIL